MDAVARIEASPKMNLWMGRFLPPSDRANLYGPYYANHWGVYTDGIQNGHPAIFQGRDNGVMSMGIVNKLLEPFAGAVLAKIFVLIALILFIQRRPRGLFPQTGRAAENQA